MADNTVLNTGSGGDSMRTIDRSGSGPKTQVISLDVGASGAGNESILRVGQQVAAASIPVVLPSAQDPSVNLDAVASLTALARLIAGIRRDADTTPVTADGDYHPFIFNEAGRLKVSAMPADIVATTGTITANGQTVSADVTKASNVAIYVTGTFSTINLTFEASIDNGTSWFTIQAVRSNANTVETTTGNLSAAPAYCWELSVNAYTNVRVRSTAYTSGTMNVRILPGAYATEPVIATQTTAVTQSGTWNIGTVTPGTAATNLGKARDSAIGATDTGIANLMVRRDAPTALTPVAGDYDVPQINAQGAQYVHPTFAGSAGATVTQVISAATTNATSVKASAGVLTTLHAINTSASWRYLKFHNVSAAPTAGSGVVATYGIPPGGGVTMTFPSGMGFSTGIGITITGGIAAADTTAIAASEVAVTLTYH